MYFNHEQLKVYQNAIAFIGWVNTIIERTKGHRNIIDQIDRAATSVALNIAEGNGKSSKKDHNRFVEISRSSALECAACLDIMNSKGIIDNKELEEGKQKLLINVRMLYKLSEHVLNQNS